MKLTESSLCFLIQNKEFTQRYILDNFMRDKITSELNTMYHQIEVMTINQVLGFRTLVLSDQAKRNVELCKITDDIHFGVLRTLPNRMDIIQLDSQNCIKYSKFDNLIIVILYNLTDWKVKCKSFIIDLNLEKVMIRGGHVTNNKEFNEYGFETFMKLISFLELSDITLKTIQGKSTVGNVVMGNYLKNQSKFKVIQVNSNWNVKVIRIGTIDVRGHYRLQPFGKRNEPTKYKWIFIEPYRKGSLTRLPQRQLN